MRRWGTRSAAERSGNILLVIAILGLLLCGAVFSLSFLTKTDVTSSSNMLREQLATNIGESIAAQIEAQVNLRPWHERFWFLEAQAAGRSSPYPLNINAVSPYANLSKDQLPLSEIEYSGIIKDLPGELRQYRLYLEVTVKGEMYAFNWDKQWEQSLLQGMNRDSTQVDKPSDSADSNATANDELIESIKKRVDAAPPPDKSANPTQTDRLRRLRGDEANFDAQTVDPDVDAPRIPKAPKKGGN